MIGALTGALTAAPAGAAAGPQHSAPLERPQSPTRTVPAEAPPSTYVVQPGDTVFDIAARFGLSVDGILTANGLSWSSTIHPGQTLVLIPAAAAPAAPSTSAPSAATHTVVAGDTVFAIAQAYGTTTEAVLTANGLGGDAIIYPGQTLIIAGAAPAPASAAPASAPPASATHTVVAGDTLFAIAQAYATSVDALLAANGLGRDAIIYPGQTLSLTAPAPAAAAAPAPPATLWASLDAEQAANAALIVRIGRELGVSDHGAAIALATAMVESSLRNLAWGDRDSLGLFQQRPSAGWGTPEQILDADRSTRVFYGGSGDPNGAVTRGLLDVAGWETLPFADAAQTVQISAFPERYGQWEAQAREWVALYG